MPSGARRMLARTEMSKVISPMSIFFKILKHVLHGRRGGVQEDLVIYLAEVNSIAWGFSLASRARSELPAPAAPYTLYIIANPRA